MGRSSRQPVSGLCSGAATGDVCRSAPLLQQFGYLLDQLPVQLFSELFLFVPRPDAALLVEHDNRRIDDHVVSSGDGARLAAVPPGPPAGCLQRPRNPRVVVAVDAEEGDRLPLELPYKRPLVRSPFPANQSPPTPEVEQNDVAAEVRQFQVCPGQIDPLDLGSFVARP